MANTTNFGWETPDDTDLVKDGALAMRTLGNAIDTSFVDLKGGTTGQNLRKATNTDLDFTWAGDATNTVIDAEGDLLVGDSADTLQRLAIGTTGQVLTVDTAIDGKIKWAAPAGGGKVLQVVSSTKTDAFSTTSTTFVDVSDLSVSITPSSATSKIYIMYTVSGQGLEGLSHFVTVLVRGSTQIAIGDAAGSRSQVTTPTLRFYDPAGMGSAVAMYLDSPNTTSATTYKIQARTTGSTVYINRANTDTDAATSFRSVSTISAWEIGA